MGTHDQHNSECTKVEIHVFTCKAATGECWLAGWLGIKYIVEHFISRCARPNFELLLVVVVVFAASAAAAALLTGGKVLFESGLLTDTLHPT